MDYAKDYVEDIWIMLQKDKPDNYILAINESHTVCEFVELSAKTIGDGMVCTDDNEFIF